MPTTTRHRDADLIAITYNTHMGRAYSDVLWLLRRHRRASLIYLQEVPNIQHLRQWMRANGLLETFRIAPGYQTPGERGLPFILVRRSRFSVVTAVSPRISFGSRHDRARTSVVLTDRVTGRECWLADIHPDPLGEGFVNANRGARKTHEAQIQAHVDWLIQAPADAVVLAGGDFNESLDDSVQGADSRLGRRTATARLRGAGLKPAWTAQGEQISRSVHLDDFFVGADPFVKIKRRVLVDPPSPEGDHPAVVVVLRVRAA